VSAKNITVIRVDGKEHRRTMKKARELFSKGNHSWRDDFTLIELKAGASDPDYSRLLLVRPIYIPQILPPRDPFGLLIHYPIRDERTCRFRV
jgi:hypothetical protein